MKAERQPVVEAEMLALARSWQPPPTALNADSILRERVRRTRRRQCAGALGVAALGLSLLAIKALPREEVPVAVSRDVFSPGREAKDERPTPTLASDTSAGEVSSPSREVTGGAPPKVRSASSHKSRANAAASRDPDPYEAFGGRK